MPYRPHIVHLIPEDYGKVISQGKLVQVLQSWTDSEDELRVFQFGSYTFHQIYTFYDFYLLTYEKLATTFFIKIDAISILIAL